MLFFALCSISLVSNGWQYAEAGISKLQLVKPLQFLINVQKFKLPTSPGLRILRVCALHEHQCTQPEVVEKV